MLLGREGCPTCAELEMDTINVLSKLGISAELNHITNPEEVKKYNISPPAFILDGSVKVVGRAPNIQEIKAILSYKLKER
ncbi:MAG: thioredoxin family protein [Candidatus Hydrothermarchaeaceae archaeon]